MPGMCSRSLSERALVAVDKVDFVDAVDLVDHATPSLLLLFFAQLSFHFAGLVTRQA